MFWEKECDVGSKGFFNMVSRVGARESIVTICAVACRVGVIVVGEEVVRGGASLGRDKR